MTIECPECGADITIEVEQIKQTESQIKCEKCGAAIDQKSSIPDQLDEIAEKCDRALETRSRGAKN